MRSSKYNIYTELNKGDDRWLLVQGGRGSFDIVNGKTVDALKKGEDDPESLNEISRENIKVLKDRGYVTELSEDEEFQFIRKLSQAINCVNSQGISITMLPTYNCNFRCEYCFERTLQNKGAEVLCRKMSEDVIDAVFSQLKKYINEGRRIDSLYLFGGEPLLRTNRKIVEYICSNARKLGIPISCISNGYDLDEYIDLILDYNFQTVQITIDGTEETHDRRRFLTGGQGTFDRILKNVDLALEKGGCQSRSARMLIEKILNSCRS